MPKRLLTAQEILEQLKNDACKEGVDGAYEAFVKKYGENGVASLEEIMLDPECSDVWRQWIINHVRGKEEFIPIEGTENVSHRVSEVIENDGEKKVKCIYYQTKQYRRMAGEEELEIVTLRTNVIHAENYMFVPTATEVDITDRINTKITELKSLNGK